MSAEEAAERYCFDDQLFSRNSAGLWEGKSNGQIFLGQAADSASTPLGYSNDRHICLISGPRGGKGTSVIIPNLCLWPGSAIVIDPKGENATVTAQRRGAGSAYAHGLGSTRSMPSIWKVNSQLTTRVESQLRLFSFKIKRSHFGNWHHAI
jgi:hypothetical protein